MMSRQPAAAPTEHSRTSGSPVRPVLSVVFSFRNEEETLPELIDRTTAVLRGLEDAGELSGSEIIFVDDDSVDGSAEIIRERAVRDGRIRMLTMSRRFGVSPCAIAGIEHAVGDAVVYLDADLQDPPELIPELVRAWRSGGDVDVVHTQRTARDGETWLKLGITRVGYFLLQRLSSIPIHREVGDFKLLSRRAVDHLLELKESNPFLRGLVIWIGFKQVIVPYERQPRFAGVTKFPILDSKVIANFLNSALISFSDAPLKLSLGLGAITFVIACAYAVFIVIAKLCGMTVPGYAALTIILLVSLSLQAIFHGVAGLYLYAIFLETKNRPRYLIRETFGFDDGRGGGNR